MSLGGAFFVQAQEARYSIHADSSMYNDLKTSNDFKVIQFGNIDALVIRLFVLNSDTKELNDYIHYMFLTCKLTEEPVYLFCRSRKVEASQCEALKEHLSQLLQEYQTKYFSEAQMQSCEAVGRPYASGEPAPGFDPTIPELLLKSTRVSTVPSPIGVNIINPSLVSWKGKILISTRTAVFGSSTKATADVISFSLFTDLESFKNWVSGHVFGFKHVIKHYTIELPDGLGLGSRTYIIGEDARFVVVGQDKLFVVFNSINIDAYPARLMYYAQVELSADESRAVVKGKIGAIDVNLYTGFQSQKNWSPFDLNGRIAFSYSLFPHLVVEPVDHYSSIEDFSVCKDVFEQYSSSFMDSWELLPESLLLRECHHERLSQFPSVAPKTVKIIGLSERFSGSLQYLSSYKALVDNYLVFYDQIHEKFVVDDVASLKNRNFSIDVGFISGGSPSISINSSHHLGFFHSRYYDYRRNSLSYAMGAYVFLSVPPFRMVALIKAPLLPALVEGKLDSTSVIGNVFYPAGVFLHGDDELWLSLGHDDQRGLVTRYSLVELLSLMEVL